MEIILALIVGWSGWTLYDAKQNQIEVEKQIAVESAVEQTKAEIAQSQNQRVYARGKYIAHDGYFISNLSPAPQVAVGCDAPLLTTDLSQPRDGQVVSVSSVDVGCR